MCYIFTVMPILQNIKSPDDIKALSYSDLRLLASELRSLIVSTVTVNGGHLASNLGVVELSLALHRIFSTPVDSIVWDVGHQCYTHKIITGRYDEFRLLRRSKGLSGFPKRSESPHDSFDTGHASTSISAALGLLAANTQLKKPGSVALVIGDGALTGGMAYEAMSHAGQLALPLIVILNDNTMSISKNVGAVSSYLSRLSATVRYQNVRRLIDRIILSIPWIGTRIHPLVLRLKRAVKAVFFKESLFADLGFEYAGPIDGHNMPLLCNVLKEARAINKPVVVHVVTKKGKGHKEAEHNPAAFHGVSPHGGSPHGGSLHGGSPHGGSPEKPGGRNGNGSSDALDPAGLSGAMAEAVKRPSYTEAFGKAMCSLAGQNDRVVAVCAAMSAGTGLTEFASRYPGRFFDVGIAEEHAVTFAAGMAAGGLRPIVAIYSTFMQRALDQLLHDVALPGLAVVFAMDRAGAVPDDGETHQGIYDIQAFRAAPGLCIIAPASAGELALALEWAVKYNGPVAIRYPKAICPPERLAYSEPMVPGKGVFVRRNKDKASVLLATSGALVEEAIEASDACADLGLGVDVYHIRFLKPVNAEAFADIAASYSFVLIAEEGVLTASVAAELAAAIRSRGACAQAIGFADRPLAQAGREELLHTAGLSAGAMRNTILSETKTLAENCHKLAALKSGI